MRSTTSFCSMKYMSADGGALRQAAGTAAESKCCMEDCRRRASGAPAPRKRMKSVSQHILDVHVQSAFCPRIGSQLLRPDRDRFRSHPSRRARSSRPQVSAPRPGPDFDDALADGGSHGVDDAANDPGIVQKVLTESLTNRHVRSPCRPFRWRARELHANCRPRLCRFAPSSTRCRDRRWCAESATPRSRSPHCRTRHA